MEKSFQKGFLFDEKCIKILEYKDEEIIILDCKNYKIKFEKNIVFDSKILGNDLIIKQLILYGLINKVII